MLSIGPDYGAQPAGPLICLEGCKYVRRAKRPANVACSHNASVHAEQDADICSSMFIVSNFCGYLLYFQAPPRALLYCPLGLRFRSMQLPAGYDTSANEP
jgi:hypothetical protein